MAAGNGTPRVIAQRLDAPVYLVQVDTTNGRVLDVRRRQYFPPEPVQTILKHGYWNAPASDTPPLDQLLADASIPAERR